MFGEVKTIIYSVYTYNAKTSHVQCHVGSFFNIKYNSNSTVIFKTMTGILFHGL